MLLAYSNNYLHQKFFFFNNLLFCAPEKLNGTEEKGRKFLKHAMLNETLLEAIITITFPCKQTIMKHDMNRLNLTLFKCRIQNLVNLLVNRRKLNVFFLLLSF